MNNPLNDLLEQRPYVLLDGAMGTALLAQGLPPGCAPERWNLDFPERIEALHRSFIAAGADLILTNTFGANRRRLELLGETEVERINRSAAELARASVAECGREIVVAGSIGPSGTLLQPYGDLSEDEARALYAEQAAALADGGVDCLWIETMASDVELTAAVAGAAATGLPLVCTFSFDSRRHTMMGLSPDDALDVVLALPVRPLAVGANCGGGTLDTVAIVAAMHRKLGERLPLVAKANCGRPRYHDGAFHYGKPPRHMFEYARLARDAGARLVGGCCGTDARHLRAMHRALHDYRPQPFGDERARRLLTDTDDPNP